MARANGDIFRRLLDIFLVSPLIKFDKEIVVSTWQSLSRQKKKMDKYDSVIIDETHKAKADQINKILESAKNARWRFGFTGTLQNNKLDQYQIKSYLGMILAEPHQLKT